MSPLALRRYRAERLLRDEFEGLRGRVLAIVRGRLRSCGVSLDQADLEASYGAAWQGLYGVMLEGQEVANVTGWLAVVTFRRAIEEHRARMRRISDEREPDELAVDGADGRDLASEIDDRRRLQALFEGLRSRLSPREREAATLCYLQGFSRAQAASRMGISEARMRKLMEGQGAGRPGVAGKVGALVQTIQRGEWCESQGSLMRAYAYGILDPDGERHRLAVAHCERCPACRSYVRSLRGLAAVLPPALLPGGLAAGALAQVGLSAHAAGSAGGGVGASGAAGGGAASAGAAAQAGGAVSATAAAGGAGAGSGWLLAGGSLTGKLAVGCVLALTVGAGCVALSGGPLLHHRAHHGRRARVAIPDAGANSSAALAAPSALRVEPLENKTNVRAFQASPQGTVLTSARRASREFGPEQALGVGGSTGSSSGTGTGTDTAPTASTASVSGSTSTAGSGGESSSASSATPSPSSATTTHTGASAAEREFAPG